MDVRALIPAGPDVRGDDDLAAAYAPPRVPFLRLNFVASVDGAAQGESGKSGSINNAADKRAFEVMRRLADAVVVGAGTARAEGYGPGPTPIVVVSASGRVPETLVGGPPDSVLLATSAGAPGRSDAEHALGDGGVLIAGEERVDLAGLLAALRRRGLRHLLCEGGPALARDLLAAGLVDELCLTSVPRLIAGDHLRILRGSGIDVDLRLVGLLEHQGTLLARWAVEGTPGAGRRTPIR